MDKKIIENTIKNLGFKDLNDIINYIGINGGSEYRNKKWLCTFYKKWVVASKNSISYKEICSLQKDIQEKIKKLDKRFVDTTDKTELGNIINKMKKEQKEIADLETLAIVFGNILKWIENENK